MTGMVAGQLPIAATATSVTSSTATLAASFMPAHTGDVTSPAGSTVNTLASVNTNVGTFQGLTVNGKGLVTAAANQSYVTGGPYLSTAGGTLTGALAGTSITTTGNVGIGTATPGAHLQVVGADGTINTLLSGGTKGITVSTTAAGSTVSGTDQTGLVSYQPLAVNGTPLSLQANGATIVTVLSGGNVGIGTTTPGSMLTVNGTCGNVSGAWTTISDASIKQDVSPYTRGLDAIVALKPVRFRYVKGTPFAEADKPSRQLFGLIADDVKPIVPEVVGSTTATVGKKQDVELSTLEPGNLIYALINSCKELVTRNNTLESRVAALEARL
jgi:hypothetical protein